ncbi:MAG: methylenetetrahydrofolate reductase [Proteobacteria bacterium]|nr:methylenetetrahydrofolate reductase [Pseudomonadota bacterium]
MDASSKFPAAVSATMANPLGAFLAKASIEVTGKQIEKFPLLSDNLAPGTKVFIALIEVQDLEAQIAAAIDLRARGFEPIPHVPARFVSDEEDLKRRIGAFTEKAKVNTILALGGGAPQPVGKYDAAIQLMETGVFQKAGITRVGIAGHPEGNPDISKARGEAALLQALKDKSAWLAANKVEGFLATQFLFEAGPLALWASQLREAGINLPISVGVPGPATIKTLVKYAAMCGVGNSARFIRKQALNITKLLTVSEPTEFVDQLATLHFDRPELNIASPHLYPFGGFDKLLGWYKAQLQAG